MDAALNKKNIYRGFRLFLLLTLVGMIAVYYATGGRETWRALLGFKIEYFLLGCALIAVDFLSGALRIHIFTRKIIPVKSFRACFKANLANMFLAAATPFQTGGGVAQLYVLNRYGISYSAALSVSLLNLIATLTLLFATGTVIMATVMRRFTIDASLNIIITVSRFTFYAALLFFLLFVFKPGIFGKAIKSLFKVIAFFVRSTAPMLERLGERILRFTEECQTYLRYFWRNEKFTLLVNLLLTGIIYFNKCFIAYVIYLGLQVKPAFQDVIMLQLLIIFFLYFAPTPGASLVAETSTSALMSLVAPHYLLSIFAVLWRFFTTYFGVILGGVVLLRLIGESGRAAPESVLFVDNA